jgi:hypothetical protein
MHVSTWSRYPLIDSKSRIPLLGRGQVTTELAPRCDKLLTEHGAAFFKPLVGDGHLLRSTRNWSPSSHNHLARLAGGTEEQIKGIADPEKGPSEERENWVPLR